jgi:hypothetical protein
MRRNLIARLNKKDDLPDRQEFLSLIERGELYLAFEKDARFAQTERGEPLQMSALYSEGIRAMLDYRIPMIALTGAAQTGKSLMAVICYSWTTARCGFNTLFLFPQQTSLYRLVPQNHKPIIDAWDRGLYPNTKRGNFTSNLQTHEASSKGNIMFTYSGAKAGDNKGASAGASIVSVSTDALYVDEASQYAPGTIDVAFRRLDAGRIPYKPVRLMGTPGSGAGIEAYIKKVRHKFYPGLICPHCNEVTFLDPLGMLFKAVSVVLPTGEKTEAFLSAAGRPMKWNSEDVTYPVDTAYLTCESCDGRISDEDIKAALFYERGTRKALKSYLDDSNYVMPSMSIELSPLLRGYKSLPRLIDQGLTTANTSDWIQQALGHASTFDSTIITLDQIKRSFNSHLPRVRVNEYDDTGWEKITVAGIDQGRSSDYLTIINYYYKREDESRERTIAEKSIREFVFIGAVARTDIPDICKHYEVEFGFIDNEPSITSAAELCDDVDGLMLCDQQAKQSDDFKKVVTRDGGVEYTCVRAAYRKFGRTLILGFSRRASDGHSLYRFNSSLEGILTDVTENSPVRHLTSVAFDPDSGGIIRPSDHVDHTWFSTLFAEMAFNYFLSEGNNESKTANWDWYGNL